MLIKLIVEHLPMSKLMTGTIRLTVYRRFTCHLCAMYDSTTEWLFRLKNRQMFNCMVKCLIEWLNIQLDDYMFNWMVTFLIDQ